MSRIRTYLLVVIASALAGMIGAAFGTGTAQAIVSTLVSVVNPATSPVQTNPVNVTDPGRIAYQAQLSSTGGGMTCSNQFCQFFLPGVSAGHRLVVQHITGVVSLSTPPTSLEIQFGIPPNSEGGFIVLNSDAYTFIVFDQPVLYYMDGGSSASLSVSAAGSAAFFAGAQNKLTVIGYELDCTVAACAPIAP